MISLNLFSLSLQPYRPREASHLRIWILSLLRRGIVISPYLRKLHLTRLISSLSGNGKSRVVYGLLIQPKDWCKSPEYSIVVAIILTYCICDDRYFQAANPSAIERHIYSVPIPLSINSSEARAEPTALTDRSEPSFFTASFSPQAGFYLQSYQGPNVPWQRIVRVNDSSKESGFLKGIIRLMAFGLFRL
jgi:hypothetical protein